mmetsp:Transcript_63471/g.156253  ORF Transcript_63471/g.156253 Transcript_63471/m.156253 type:complete len:366 (+) Transcript_63471:130-1227(+)
MDDYESIKQLAKGGQGITICVRRKTDNAKFVLKQTQCENVRAGNDALREAKMLQGLRHSSVTRYHDVFLHSANGYLVVCTVMELCNRGDLANYLFDKRRRQSPLTEQVVRSWLGQLTDAMAYLHGQRILHRDLKPHNVFLTNEGILKVGDFGLSATLAQGKRTTHVGTPCYLAPEVMNREAYGESVDLWGIGCIGYEMMTLDFLWEKKGILAASVLKTPLKPEALPDRFSYFLRECVAKSLAYTPSQRPPASDLLIRVRRSGKDDTGALAKALEGFVGADALNQALATWQHHLETFSGSFKNLFLSPGEAPPPVFPGAQMSKVQQRSPEDRTSGLIGALKDGEEEASPMGNRRHMKAGGPGAMNV